MDSTKKYLILEREWDNLIKYNKRGKYIRELKEKSY